MNSAGAKHLAPFFFCRALEAMAQQNRGASVEVQIPFVVSPLRGHRGRRCLRRARAL
jgi:hypothetical protein